jgi:hypothetical protein
VLKVNQIRSDFSAAICEGGSYTFGARTLTQRGFYADTLVGAGGCDSISTLDLVVLPEVVNITEELCEGQSFLIGNEVFSVTGTYTRTLENTLGCDSTVNLNLRIYPSLDVRDTTICRGYAYAWADTIIITPGHYERFVVNSTGCPTSYKLDLAVTLPQPVLLTDFVCEGNLYNNHGFRNLYILNDTVLTEELVNSANGCDSINSIAVAVVRPVHTTDYISVENSQLPYYWCENSLTTPGIYTCTFSSLVTGCDSLVTLTFDVTTGLDNVNASRAFTVTPNPVKKNQTVYINHEFTAEERNNLRVVVVNTLGQVVRDFTSTSETIEVEGLNTSGFYLIRVTTGTGAIYHGEVIVK